MPTRSPSAIRSPRPDDRAHAARTRAINCVRRLVSALRQSARAVESKTGVTNAQLLVLQQLAHANGLTINEIAARTMTIQSTASLVVTRLVNEGLATRERSADDGRKSVVRVTAHGRRIASTGPASPGTRLLEAIEEMAPADREALSRGIGALLKAMHVPARGATLLFDSSEA